MKETETQKAIEQEANNRYGSLLDIKVNGTYEAKEVVQNCINAFIAGGKWVMEEYAGKSLEEKEKEIERLKRLVSYAHQHGFARGQTANVTIESSWATFKQANNL